MATFSKTSEIRQAIIENKPVIRVTVRFRVRFRFRVRVRNRDRDRVRSGFKRMVIVCLPGITGMN